MSIEKTTCGLCGMLICWDRADAQALHYNECNGLTEIQKILIEPILYELRSIYERLGKE